MWRLLKSPLVNLLQRLSARAQPMEYRESADARQSKEYWTGYNVTDHAFYSSAEESLAALAWRNAQYFGYEDLMPVNGAEGKVVLDFGCGPGHDLVGFGVYSRPAFLIGADVSSTSLREANVRLKLHGIKASLVQLESASLPLGDAEVDVIHCSGVLHHVDRPEQVLAQFRRVLKGDGEIQLMTYNYYSIWMQLYAAFVYRFETPEGKGLTLAEAFRRSTDSPECPISFGWRPEDVIKMCAGVGLQCEHIGDAVAVQELELLKNARFRAIASRDLEQEHRDFLRALTFDQRGIPHFRGQAAGIDSCFRVRRR